MAGQFLDDTPPGQAGVLLTDPPPLPKDSRCPTCRASEMHRQLLTPFGRAPYQVCSQCGYEFPRED